MISCYCWVLNEPINQLLIDCYIINRNINKIYLGLIYVNSINYYVNTFFKGANSMFKGKKDKGTSKPNAQNKAEQAAIQNPDNPRFSNEYKGKQGK